MMLLKNDRVAGEEKQCACVGGGILLFFFSCPVSVYLHVCMECVCVFLFCFFLLASMCIDDLLFRRGYYALML